jgi:hypothetical protein
MSSAPLIGLKVEKSGTRQGLPLSLATGAPCHTGIREKEIKPKPTGREIKSSLFIHDMNLYIKN